MPRKGRKAMMKMGKKRAVGRDGRSSASTLPYRRREGGVVAKGVR